MLNNDDRAVTGNDYRNCTMITVNTNPIGPVPSTVVTVTNGRGRRSFVIISLIITGVLITAALVTLTAVLIERNSKVSHSNTTMATNTTVKPRTTTEIRTKPYKFSFAAQKSYITDVIPVALSVADVNDDNKLDIIVANEEGFTISVFLNLGNGSLLPQKTYSTKPGSFPQSVSAADINGDKKVDLVVSLNVLHSFDVYFNYGNGTFFHERSYRTGKESYPPGVTTADLDGDRAFDVIIANQNENNIGVFFNLGNGTFTTQQIYQLPYGTAPTSPFVGDVNGDNKPDIVFASYGACSVGVLFNLGNRTFSVETTYRTGNESHPRFVTLADVNEDTKLDLIVVNSHENNIGVLLNTGNGTLLPQTNYSTGVNSDPRCVAMVDLNGDFRADMIVANFKNDSVAIFANFGNGTFILQKTYSTGIGSSPQFVSVFDLNGDDKPDIVVANAKKSTIGVMLASDN